MAQVMLDCSVVCQCSGMQSLQQFAGMQVAIKTLHLHRLPSPPPKHTLVWLPIARLFCSTWDAAPAASLQFALTALLSPNPFPPPPPACVLGCCMWCNYAKSAWVIDEVSC